MATYGYQPRVYGQQQGGYLRPASRFLSPVASALAGPSPVSAIQGEPKNQAPFTSPVAPIRPALGPGRGTPATLPQQTAAPVTPQGQPQSTAPTPGVYDLNTDPALQQIQAFTGMSDQNAQAAALKARQNQLLQYGDPNLAQALLGDSTFAAAVGQNPTSTVHQLEQQRQRNVSALTEALNKANLFYGGYRVNQEQQAAQDYQNQLAGAAGNVNQNLDTIAGNLAQALAQNQAQRIQAEQAARDRAVQAALAGGYSLGPTDTGPVAYPGASEGGPTGYVIGQGVPIQQALAGTGYPGAAGVGGGFTLAPSPLGADVGGGFTFGAPVAAPTTTTLPRALRRSGFGF